MPKKPIIYTAVFRGKEYTKHTRGWIELIGRSCKYTYALLREAEEINHINKMQYVIDCCEFKMVEKKKKPKQKRSSVRMGSGDSIRMRKQERFNTGIKTVMDNFFYPPGAEQTVKREGWKCQI